MFELRSRKCSVSAAMVLFLISLTMLVISFDILPCSAVGLPFVINDGAEFSNSTTVTLTLNASAFLPSVPSTAEMSISNDNHTWSGWEPYATSKSWTLTSGDGLKIVYFRVRLDGDSPPSQVQFRPVILDTVLPLLVMTFPVTNDMVWEFSAFPLEWTVTDSESGLNHVEVSLDGGTWTNVGTQTIYGFSGLSNGTHIFAIKAMDNAGNSQIVSRSVNINTASSTPALTPTPTSTPHEEGFTSWLIVGATVAAVAIAVAAVIVFKLMKRSKDRSKNQTSNR